VTIDRAVWLIVGVLLIVIQIMWIFNLRGIHIGAH
jgi:hypothetical protein